MTNYERLLDLPFREILNELGAKKTDFLDCCKAVLSEITVRCDKVPFCKACDDTPGSCSNVLESWLERESDSDANYNEDVWHDAEEEDPPTSDTTIEYQVFITGAELPTTLVFDGEHWLDSYANHYNVDYWRSMPKRPEK